MFNVWNFPQNANEKSRHWGCCATLKKIPGIQEVQQVLALPSLQQLPKEKLGQVLKKKYIDMYVNNNDY